MGDIDFVVMWVDGNDPAWQTERNNYLSPDVAQDGCSANRFRDWGLMKYWFRSVEKFAPWVHKVYFVTWGHTPEFLNLDAEKLVVVKHEDFMPEEYLPTFSANPIELNLHRIPGVSSQFVLFNDDMLLTRPVQPETFFKNNLPCAYYAEIPFVPSLDMGVFQPILFNDISVLNRNFDKGNTYKQNYKKYYDPCYLLKDKLRTFILHRINPDSFSAFKNFHCPAAYLKSTYETVWDKEFDVLNKTSSEKFRSDHDVNQYIMLWWQLLSGQFAPSKIDNKLYSISDKSVDDIINNIIHQTSDMICINDGDINADLDMLSKQIQHAFEIILPEKSSFEL